MAQPFKRISSLMGLKGLEQRKELSKSLEVQKKAKTSELKEVDKSKEKPKPPPPREKKREEKKIEIEKSEEEKKVESALDSSSASLVTASLPQDGSGSIPSLPPALITENKDSFGAPIIGQHGARPDHKELKVVAADPDLVAAIPIPETISESSEVGGQYNKFFNQADQVKGFFQLLTTKLAQLASPPLKGALEGLHAACSLIAGNEYPSDTGLKFLIVNFETLETKLEAYRKEAGSDAKGLEPLAQSVEQYKVALIIQACLDPRYDAKSKDTSLRNARARFIKNASPEVIEKVGKGLQAHIEKLKEGDGAEARNATEIARLGKVLEEGLPKPEAAMVLK